MPSGSPKCNSSSSKPIWMTGRFYRWLAIKIRHRLQSARWHLVGLYWRTWRWWRDLWQWLRREYYTARDNSLPYRVLAVEKMHSPTELALLKEEFLSSVKRTLSQSSEAVSSFVSQVPTRPKTLPGSLWCITTYFNPNGIKVKRYNYDIFAQELRRQKGKLLTVELSFGDGDFELSKANADLLIQVRGDSVLWQKERLLNLALDHLPQDCDKVVWIDADVVFSDGNWLQTTAQLLEKYLFVQPFSFRLNLGKDSSSADLSRLFPVPRGCFIEPGYMFSYFKLHGAEHTPNKHFTYPNHGSAWASRRELLNTIRFYDCMIMGGGDTVMVRALMGDCSHNVLDQVSEQLRNDIISYTQRVSSVVGGSIYYQDGLLIHLWHGNVVNREYWRRLRLLRSHEFDPQTDIKLSETGTWKWATDKEELHTAVKKYFHLRREEAL